MKTVKKLLVNVPFFHKMNIDVINEYTNDLHPKCFLVLSKDDGIKYKIRISINEKESSVEKELKAFQYLQKNNVTCLPEIYYYHFGKDFNILIYEYFEGASLEKIHNLTKSDYDIILSDLIPIIKKFDSLKNDHCMSFTRIYNDWYDYFMIKMGEHVGNMKNESIFSPKEKTAIKKICRSFKDEMKSKQNTFLHYDIKPKNIVYDQVNKKAYLIDYELGRFGDRLMEFAKIESRSWNKDYTSHIVDPIFDHFNVNKTYGKNLFTLYLLYCYIVYYYYDYKIFLDTGSQYHKGQSEIYKTRSRDLFDRLW